jgi:cytoskeletal protein CcmA (bactofilin family)
MPSEVHGSVKISGTGTASGGIYECVSISGSGEVTGDVEAGQITISGAAKMAGNVKAAVVKSSGALKIEGGLEAGEFSSSGSAKVTGRARIDTLDASGSVRIDGDLSGGKVSVSGRATFGGDVEVEQFRSSGSLATGGLLNADRIGVVLGGDARARELGGGEVHVMAGGRGRGLLNWYRPAVASLEAETVEGDDIYLEATRAATVRGRRVAIGPGCTIGKLEYSESLHIDADARVDTPQYTGQGSASAPITGPVQRPEGWARGEAGKLRPGWDVSLNGMQIRNPALRLLSALLGLVVAAVVIGVVAFVVLPAVGIAVSLTLLGVTMLLLLILVGLPLLVCGSLLSGAFRHYLGARRHRSGR